MAVPACPRCRAAVPGLPSSDGWTQCTACQHRFRPVLGSNEYMPGDDDTVHGLKALTVRVGEEEGALAPLAAPAAAAQAPAAPRQPVRAQAAEAVQPESDLFEKLEKQAQADRAAMKTMAEVPAATTSPATEAVQCPVCGHAFQSAAADTARRCPQCKTSFDPASGRISSGFPGQAPSDPLIGKVLRGCLVDRKLGEGGMGAVYHAKQLSLDRSVAIKILPPELARNKNFISRFEREAKSLARINHQNILQIYDFGDDPGLGIYFMIIEFVAGRDLGDILSRQSAISEVQCLDLLRQALQGLEQAAEKEVVHRDIKPDNLMIAENGTVKVSDFGLAKAHLGETEVTSVGVRVGTPAFMSPEQCDGVEVTWRSDVYNLGCTAFLALTGTLPFDGDTPFAIMLKHKHEEVPSLRGINPMIDLRVDSLVRRMMAKDPEDRCRNLRELADDVESLLIKLAGTASVLRKTHGPMRALHQPPEPTPPRADSRRAPVAAPVPRPAASPDAIPDYLRPVDLPNTRPPAAEPAAEAVAAPAAPKRPSRRLALAGADPTATPMPEPRPAGRASSRLMPVAAGNLDQRASGPVPALGHHRAGSSGRLVIDRARDRARQAEAESVIAAAERLEQSGSHAHAAVEFVRASGLVDDPERSAELRRRAERSTRRSVARRRNRRALIAGGVLALIGANAFIWPPVMHNAMADREFANLELIADPAARRAAMAAFAASNDGGWRWYERLFFRTYRVAAAERASQRVAISTVRREAPRTAAVVVDTAQLEQLAADPKTTWQEVIEAATRQLRNGKGGERVRDILDQARNQLQQVPARLAAIDAARAAGRHGEALDLSAVFARDMRRAGPAALESLPLPGRLTVRDADSGAPVAAQVVVDGVVLQAPRDRFCRWRDRPTAIEVTAAGFVPGKASVPADAEVRELTVPIALAAAPLWTVRGAGLVAGQPGWLRLLAAGADTLAVLRESGLSAFDPATGNALDVAGSRGEWQNGLTGWFQAGPAGLRVATRAGELVQFAPLDRARLGAATVLARRRGPVFASLEIEAVFQAGKRLQVTVEDGPGGRRVVARDGEQERWSYAALSGLRPPQMRRAGELALVLDDQAAHLLEEDGRAAAVLRLRGPRLGEAVEVPGAGALLVPTVAGLDLLRCEGVPAPGAALADDPALAAAGVARPLAGGGKVLLLRDDQVVDAIAWRDGRFTATWRQTPGGRPTWAAIDERRCVVADEAGRLVVLDAATGTVSRRISHGTPLTADPLLLGDLLVVADGAGSLVAYRL